MEVQGLPRSGRAIPVLAVFAIMCLVLGATVVYFNLIITQQNADSKSANSELQGQVSSLQGQMSSLLGEVSTLKTSLSALESSVGTGGQSTGSSSGDSTALAIYRNASASVVTIMGDNRTVVNTIFGPVVSYSVVEGSGFAVTYGGAPYIVTNFHVVRGTSNTTVKFSDGNAYPGKLVGSDVYADLAVLNVSAPASEFRPLNIADSAGLAVGDSVFAIGAPFGLSGTFTTGVISQLGRTITEATAGAYAISGILQFTAPINPGNSGGPLLDSEGDVVGITTATISGSQGLGFAIPSHTIVKELPSLIANGEYLNHSYLGIAGVDMNYQLAQASKTSVTYGVLVEQVTSRGPASAAGIRAGSTQVDIAGTTYLVGGDIIVSVNNVKVTGTDALSSYLEENTVAGQSAVLGILRGGAAMNVTVTLGQRPQP